LGSCAHLFSLSESPSPPRRPSAEGLAILVIDKNVSALIPLADRHHIVEKGRVVWTGTSRELAADSDLQHRYLGV
jgi:branched-chain amino acid transport system ATP-binding protein